MERITLGGEISEQGILNSLQNKYCNAKVVHIYASTEAGVGFAVRDGKSGFSAGLLFQEDERKNFLKISDGCLWVKSNGGADKLLNGTLDVDLNGYINTGDLVEKRDNRVYFLGRASGAINIGGNKVMPEEVESVLNTMPDIVVSRVSAKKNSLLGALISAEVVLSTTTAFNAKKIKLKILAYCNEQLVSYKVPVIIKFVDHVPTNESGKIVRVK